LLVDVRTGSNALVLHAAQSWCDPATVELEARLVLCWGASGVGKTLLAQALYNSTANQLTTCWLSPASPVTDFEAALSADAVVVDDVHALDAEQAKAAFNLYNHIRDTTHSTTRKRWWATSRVLPSHMSGVIPDLSSRMAWGLVFELLPLADEDSIVVLQAQATRLGFVLTAETAQYLLLRLERNLGALAQHMGSLNHYALMLKKPINNYLVQQWYATQYLPSLQNTLL
jgi:DnaA family protein